MLVILTGSEVVDQIFSVLLSTSMFVGGLTGFILDNTVPGSSGLSGVTVDMTVSGNACCLRLVQIVMTNETLTTNLRTLA